jgi:hypothetical protein
MSETLQETPQHLPHLDQQGTDFLLRYQDHFHAHLAFLEGAVEGLLDRRKDPNYHPSLDHYVDRALTQLRRTTDPAQLYRLVGEIYGYLGRKLPPGVPYVWHSLQDQPGCAHPDYAQYRKWEQEVATPALAALGYTVTRWWSGEQDSFGALIRCGQAVRDDQPGLSFYFIYG